MTDTTLSYDIQSAMNRGLSQVMNGQAPDLPPLHWSVTPWKDWELDGISGLVGGRHSEEEAPGIARAWAERFELEAVPRTDRNRHKREYSGHINGQPVRVWAIADLETFDRRSREARESAGIASAVPVGRAPGTR